MRISGFLLLTALLTSAFNFQPVNASVIVIDPDGDVWPSAARAKIQRTDNVYTFTDNIYCDCIQVYKGGITISGKGYTLHGPGHNSSSCGFHIMRLSPLDDVNDVIIQGVIIENFECGIRLDGGTNDHKIFRNTIADCRTGVKLGVNEFLQFSSNNEFYQNNFMYNCRHVGWDSLEGVPSTPYPHNNWDNGYPPGGNYWSNYTVDDNSVNDGPNAGEPNKDGIGDEEYTIDDNNIDHFPLTHPYMLSVRNLQKESDYYTIQEAVNDANRGDTIRVLSGVYYQGRFHEQRYYEYDTVNVKSVDVNKPVWLKGVGRSRPVIDAVRNGGDVVNISASHTHIEGFTIQNAADGNCGIYMNGVRFNHIIDNTITDNPVGIKLHDSSNYNALLGNRITDNNSGGINIDDCNNVFVCKNTIKQSYNGFGIAINNSDRARIVRNTLESNEGGAFIQGCCIDNEIRGNNVSSNVDGSNGIVIQAGGDANTTVISNRITSSYDGIELSNTSCNRITDNIVSGNSRYGLYLYYASGTTIEDNVVKSNDDDGINLRESDNVWITANEISNNKPYGTGIRIAWSDNVSITANKVHDNQYYGIALFAGSSDCNIVRNILTSNSDGIYFSDSSNGTITKNKIKDNTFSGIYLNDSENNTIYHNVLIDNGEEPGDNAVASPDYENKWYLDWHDDPCIPSGGNFWSDYQDVTGIEMDDSYHGESQNLSGGDYENGYTTYGIADQGYPIIEGDPCNTDRYPLILVGCKITTDPIQPEMKKSYILDVNLVNCSGDLAPGYPEDMNVYFAGANQVQAIPGPWMDWVPDLPEGTPPELAWIGIGNWELKPNKQQRYLPEPCPRPIAQDEKVRFRLRFRNNWNWIKPNDWAGVTTSLICAIHKIPTKITAGVAIFRLIWACYDACRAVPAMTYIFEPLQDSSDILIFSKAINVHVPEEKQDCLIHSLGTQVLSIECAICAFILSSNPLTAWAAPPFWVASALYTIESIAFYYVAEDPSRDFTEIFQVDFVDVPTGIELYSAGIEAGTIQERLALAALELACLEKAYGESYMRYDCARIADYNDATPDCNDPNEYYMGLQLAAALRYNAMAINKLQKVQFLTAVLTEGPDVYAQICSITDDDVSEFWQEIHDNGLPQIQKDILQVFDHNEPDDANDPNRPGYDDIKNVILAATAPDPCDPNLAALRDLYRDPDNIFKFGHAIIASHYLQSHALQTVVEEEGLTNHFQSAYANDIAIISVRPSVTEMYAGGMVTINVEIENLGNANAATDVNVYVYVDDVNTTDVLGPRTVNDLAAGEKTTLTFTWDTNGIDELTLLPDGCTYRIKAEANTLEGELFIFDNIYIGAAVDVSPVPDSPAVPTELLCTDKTHNTISLAWTPGVSGASGYRIYRDGYYLGWSSGISCTDTGLIPCTTYTYTVSACDDVNESGNSKRVTVTTSRNADINNNCCVDYNDLAIMAENWLEQEITADRPGDFGDIYCDCNGSDGSVNLLDYAVLADRWRDDCNQHSDCSP